MNPALQNYLQNQQQQQAAPQQQSQPYNPFDSGIQKAIASARQSLGMTANQEEDAFNKGLLAFGDAIAQTPPEKGFWNNLTSAGRALSPGIRAYDEAEAGSLAQNQALANEILKQDALERNRQAEAEERAWRRQLAERQLGEQKRNHDLLAQIQMNQLAQKAALEGNKTQNSAWLHREQHNTTKLVPQIAEQYQKNQEILPGIDEFKTLLSTSNLAGASRIAGLKRFVAQQTGQDEDVLNARNLGQFYLEWMNSNSKGTLSDKDLQEYKATFADLEKNPAASIKVLDRLKKKLENQQGIFTTKLQAYEEDQGANLNSLDIINRKNQPNVLPLNAQESPRENKTPYTRDESSVLLYNPKTDEETWAHPDDVDALKEIEGWEEA